MIYTAPCVNTSYVTVWERGGGGLNSLNTLKSIEEGRAQSMHRHKHLLQNVISGIFSVKHVQKAKNLNRSI
jgi:hypothetical protein